jgi:hypothetical protein
LGRNQRLADFDHLCFRCFERTGLVVIIRHSARGGSIGSMAGDVVIVFRIIIIGHAAAAAADYSRAARWPSLKIEQTHFWTVPSIRIKKSTNNTELDPGTKINEKQRPQQGQKRNGNGRTPFSCIAKEGFSISQKMRELSKCDARFERLG